MIAAAVCFSVAISLVRYLSATFSTFEIVFFRQSFGIVIMLPWLIRFGIYSLRTNEIRIYLVRAVVTYTGMLAGYYAVTLITIADSIALQFTLPFFTIIGALVFLGERVYPHRWIATIVGFAGALIIIRPGFAEVHPGMLVALSTAVLFGLSDTCTRYLSGRDSVGVVIFYGFLLQLPIAAVPAALTWVTPSLSDIPWILVFVVPAIGAQYCITRSFAAAEASLVSPVLFIRLPLVALIGFAFFDELPGTWTWVGAAVLIGSTYYSTRRDAAITRVANRQIG